MNDNLVKRLREPYTQRQSRRVDAEFAAADRIEELEKWKRYWQGEIDVILAGRADAYDRIEELEAKLAQQDDLVQAAVAAALREVHDAIAEYPLVAPDEMEAQHYDEQIGHSQSIILALIPQDAQAALDRALAAERERCAEQAESHN